MDNLLDSEIFMIENHYMDISDIYKLPIMDFLLFYTKIIININQKIKKAKDTKQQKKQGGLIK